MIPPMTTYQDIYNQKLTTPDTATDLVEDRSNLILGMSASMPPALMAAIGDKASHGAYSSLDLFYMHSTQAAAESLIRADLMDVVHPHPLFMSAFDRMLAEEGIKQGKDWVDFIPCMFHQAGRLLTENISPDCFIATVSPMDKAGFFSLGTNADYGATVVRHAKRVIVEVNENMPRTFGECLVHVNDVDLIVENNVPLMQGVLGPPEEIDITIANQIAEKIPDGATLQMGIGAIPSVVLEQLSEHNDLGLHTELFSTPMVPLIKSGVINGRAKSIMTHKHVYTLAIGDEATYDFMDDNPSIVGYPADWVNAPAVIRKNDRMISVNAALEVDLTGQINAESMNGRPLQSFQLFLIDRGFHFDLLLISPRKPLKTNPIGENG